LKKALQTESLFCLVSLASVRYAYSATADDFSNDVKSNPFSPNKEHTDKTDRADERGFDRLQEII
jgi:hypothetical protein